MAWFGFGYIPTMSPEELAKPLGERKVFSTFPNSDTDPAPGRRLRVFAKLVSKHSMSDGSLHYKVPGTNSPFVTRKREATYARAMALLWTSKMHRDIVSSLPLRVSEPEYFPREVPEEWEQWRDPDLHHALQDLADEMAEDIREACGTMDGSVSYYPGVNDIEPLSDKHVELVMWALQRELNRELRGAPGQQSGPPLPPVKLSQDLSPEVQRALAERRRLRFREYGITPQSWKTGRWSLWAIPEDPDWQPRRGLRLSAG